MVEFNNKKKVFDGDGGTFNSKYEIYFSEKVSSKMTEAVLRIFSD